LSRRNLGKFTLIDFAIAMLVDRQK